MLYKLMYALKYAKNAILKLIWSLRVNILVLWQCHLSYRFCFFQVGFYAILAKYMANVTYFLLSKLAFSLIQFGTSMLCSLQNLDQSFIMLFSIFSPNKEIINNHFNTYKLSRISLRKLYMTRKTPT